MSSTSYQVPGVLGGHGHPGVANHQDPLDNDENCRPSSILSRLGHKTRHSGTHSFWCCFTFKQPSTISNQQRRHPLTMPHPNHPLYQDVAAFPTSRLLPYTCCLCPGNLLFCCYQGSAITRHRTLAIRSVLSTNSYDYAAPKKTNSENPKRLCTRQAEQQTSAGARQVARSTHFAIYIAIGNRGTT
jgi:hypothetical protein